MWSPCSQHLMSRLTLTMEIYSIVASHAVRSNCAKADKCQLDITQAATHSLSNKAEPCLTRAISQSRVSGPGFSILTWLTIKFVKKFGYHFFFELSGENIRILGLKWWKYRINLLDLQGWGDRSEGALTGVVLMEKLLFKTDFLFSPFWFAHNKELFAGVTALPSFCPIFCWNFIGEDILLKLYWWRYFVETSLVKIFGWNFIVKIFRLHRPTCATHFTSPGHWQGSLKIIVSPNLGYLQTIIWILRGLVNVVLAPLALKFIFNINFFCTKCLWNCPLILFSSVRKL